MSSYTTIKIIRSRMVFDPNYPAIDMNDFKECMWKDFYWELKEVITPNPSRERGKEVHLRWYIDSNYAREKKTRRSSSGLFIFLNNALVQWFSNKQATIETSVFEAEFVHINTVMETIQGIRYKMRMMGVPTS